ncbi:hypothetical protein R1flu_027740 [Riccia fluitans]|uniref:Uncharacterized protein n=1 Tax=Riccia fluitans TaxID=41844 RepID=A0ABD1XJQ0_9MARC
MESEDLLQSERLGEPAEEALVYDLEPPLIVGKMGIVKFGDSPPDTSQETEHHEEGPTEVILNEDYELPDPLSSRILLAKETSSADDNGIIVPTPLPFLGHFTSFGRVCHKTKTPPKIQSRWRLVRIPIRIKQDLPSKPPNTTKIIDPLESKLDSPMWTRPHVPIDPKCGRRILHHYPVTGDKKKAQKRAARQEKKMYGNFDEDFATVWAGIEGTDDGIMKETLYTVHKDDQRQEDRKIEMWEQWDLNVFNYIQRQTGDKINSDTYRPDQVSIRNAALQTKYCEAVKRRRTFLDIIHEDEYNPFEFRDAALKYSDKEMYDPIKHDWDKEKREKRFMGDVVSEKSQTREMLSMFDWTEPEFKASLAGHVTCDDELQDRVHLAPVPE